MVDLFKTMSKIGNADEIELVVDGESDEHLLPIEDITLERDTDTVPTFEDGMTIDQVGYEFNEFSMELEAHEELMRLQQEILESHERMRALHTIIAMAEALEESYDDEELTNHQIAREIRLQAEQLRGNC